MNTMKEDFWLTIFIIFLALLMNIFDIIAYIHRLLH